MPRGGSISLTLSNVALLLLHFSAATGFAVQGGRMQVGCWRLGLRQQPLPHGALSSSSSCGRRTLAEGALASTCSLTSDGRGGQRVRGVVKMESAIDGCSVYIVGAMHYNPVSIRRVEATVLELASTGELTSVVIESCPTRWNATQTQPKWLRTMLESEMGAAARLAEERGVALVLGDQRIEDTSDDIKNVVKETLGFLASPLSGGWARAASDVVRAASASLAAKDRTGLGLDDLLDPMLIAAAPVTFIRYPAAWIIRSPMVAIGFVAFTTALGLIPEAASALVWEVGGAGGEGSDVVSAWAGYLVSLSLSAVEIVVISRLFLVALLDKRNEFIANSIRGACARARAERGEGKASAVVAVLGMAHVNGVQRLLATTAWETEASQ